VAIVVLGRRPDLLDQSVRPNRVPVAVWSRFTVRSRACAKSFAVHRASRFALAHTHDRRRLSRARAPTTTTAAARSIDDRPRERGSRERERERRSDH